MSPSLLALVAALSPEAAAATFQIGWQAPEPVRYHAEAVVQTPRGFLYTSGQNIEVRGIRVDIQADLSCTGAPLGKVSKVVCTFSDVKMQAQAVPTAGAQQRIDQLFAGLNADALRFQDAYYSERRYLDSLDQRRCASYEEIVAIPAA